MIWIALGRGLAAACRPRLVATWYLFSVLLALLVALPYFLSMETATSQLGDPELKAAALQAPWFDDFKRQQAPALAAISSAAGLATWGWLLVSSLLTGGTVCAFARRSAERRKSVGEEWTWRSLAWDAVRHGPGMLRLLLVALVFAFLSDLLFNKGMGWLHDRYFTMTENESLAMIVDWLRQGLFLVATLAWATWVDLARVTYIVERRRSVLRAMVDAGREFLGRPVAMLGVVLVFMSLELGLMFGTQALLAQQTTGSAIQLSVWFLVTQVMILLRLGLGIGRIAAYTCLVEDAEEEREVDMVTALA